MALELRVLQGGKVVFRKRVTTQVEAGSIAYNLKHFARLDPYQSLLQFGIDANREMTFDYLPIIADDTAIEQWVEAVSLPPNLFSQ